MTRMKNPVGYLALPMVSMESLLVQLGGHPQQAEGMPIRRILVAMLEDVAHGATRGSGRSNFSRASNVSFGSRWMILTLGFGQILRNSR